MTLTNTSFKKITIFLLLAIASLASLNLVNSVQVVAQENGGIKDAIIEDINPIDDVTGTVKDLGDTVGDLTNGDLIGAAGNLTCAAGNFISIAPLLGTVTDKITDRVDKCSNGIGSECEGINIYVGWLICPIVRAADSFIVNFLDEAVEDLFTINLETGEGLGETRSELEQAQDSINSNPQNQLDLARNGALQQAIDSGQLDDEGSEAADTLSAMKQMWTNMRNITNALFVILFVVAIFGHVTGAIEAYTAKKIIPRIVIAAILTQLSWFISVELSAIFDDFGKGIGALLETTLEVEDVELVDVVFPDKGEANSENDVLTSASILFGIGTSIVVLSATTVLWLLLPFAIGILVSIMITVVTLLARKVILIMMVIVSPIAMTMWALPTTDKWSRRWFSWYTRLLAMFPFIVALIAVGKAVAKVLSGAGQEGNNERSWIFTIAALLTYMAPYALLPLTLKLAISTISNLTGVLDNAGKSLTGRAKSFAQQQRTDIKGQKRKDNLDLYASSNKLRNADLKTSHGRKKAAQDFYGRTKGRLFSGAALPTRYNNQVIDDLAAQAQQESIQRADADDKQTSAHLASVAAGGGEQWRSYKRNAVIEN